jgi:choline dehydrogenase-like flavoprotein
MKWVVVGAGSAGCVVARRLVDVGHDVTLVECGPALTEGAVPPAIDGDDALAALAVAGRTQHGLQARRTAGSAATSYWRGRGVGGSSAVNGMVARWGSDDLYRSWGWGDLESLRRRVLLPTERPDTDELGRLDRLLLAGSPDASIVPLTRRRGRRITSAEAYLWPATGRIEVVTDEVVDRVLLDESGAATGIRLASGTDIAADRTVLCAGAIHTPAILLRSGVDVGVGTGLADHPAAGLVLKMRDRGRVSGLVTAVTIEDGPIQTTPLNHLGPDAPDDLAVLSVALLTPSAHSGTVRLASDDPSIHPLVDLDLLSSPDDVERLADAVCRAIDLVDDGPIAKAVQAVYVDDVGTDVDVLAEPAALRSWLNESASGYVHAACSCADAVGSNGAVRGHQALDIADASVFPAIPDANLQLPVTLLAEHFVAAWIEQD